MPHVGFDRGADPERERPPLLFHSVHSLGVTRSDDGSRVVKRRYGGLAFSNRPISINEKVAIRLSESCGYFEIPPQIGLMAIDPESLRGSDIAEQTMYRLIYGRGDVFLGSLHEQYIKRGSLLMFSLSSNGDIHFSVDGGNKSIFLAGIDCVRPLWMIFDVRGALGAAEFVHSPTPSSPLQSTHSIDQRSLTFVDSSLARLNDMTRAGIDRRQSEMVPLKFHDVFGKTLLRSMDCTRIRRLPDYTSGVAFSDRPIEINERVWIHVDEIDSRTLKSFPLSLRFGVTTINPETFRDSDLLQPHDVVVSRLMETQGNVFVGSLEKEVVSEGSIVQFCVSSNGKIHCSINRDYKGIFISGIDTSILLWLMVEVQGTTRAIEFVTSSDCMDTCSRMVRSTIPIRIPDSPVSRPVPNRAVPVQSTRIQMPSSSSSFIPSVSSSIFHRANYQKPSSSLNDSLPMASSLARRAGYQMTSSSMNIPPGAFSLPRGATTESGIHQTSSSSMNSIVPVPSALPPDVEARVQLLQLQMKQSMDELQKSMNERQKSMQDSMRNLLLDLQKSSSTRASDECKLCMDAAVDAVIYPCGHMMCFECAVKVKKDKRICPFCRKPIRDVIKTFKA